MIYAKYPNVDANALRSGVRIRARLLHGLQPIVVNSIVRFVSWPWVELDDGHVVHVNTIIEIIDEN